MEIVVRATIVYWFLWLVMRGIGKRELSEMSPFELILLVTFGDLVQQGVTQEDFSVTGVVIAVGTFAFWVVLVAYGQFRWPRVRRVVNGTAAVVVRDGVPLERVLRLQRTTLDDVHEAAREQGIGNLRDVRLGILEPDGKFSFIRADSERPSQPGESVEP
jgi:uncharacterized membrane protein YcaP (DUF421 family)